MKMYDDFTSRYRSKDGRFVVLLRGLEVFYLQDGEEAANFKFSAEGDAVKKFNQLRRMLMRTGG